MSEEKNFKELYLKMKNEEHLQRQKTQAAKEAADLELARAKRRDARHADSMTYDDQGNKVRTSELLKREVERNLKAEGQAFQSWYAAMLGFLSVCSLISKNRIHILSDIGHGISDMILAPLYKKGRDWFRGTPEVDLGKLEYSVSFSDDNKIQFEDLSFPSKDIMNMTVPEFKQRNAELNDLFKKGINIWLEQEGYKPDVNNKGAYTNANGDILTKEKFDEIKALNLNKFLTNSFELNFEEKPAVRPSM